VACQEDADKILPELKHLAETVAANGQHLKIFISYEPATGPVDWTGFEFVDWLICGGESGAGARQYRWEWGVDTFNWCQENGVAYFHKQNGSNFVHSTNQIKPKKGKGADPLTWPSDLPREYIGGYAMDPDEMELV
jgi:protein gp37